MMQTESVLPFQLDNSDVRGRIVRFKNVLGKILSRRKYPPSVEELVAETMVLTAVIGQSIKLRWKLSLQVRGDGPVRLIASDYFAPDSFGLPARIRVYSSFDSERTNPHASLPFKETGKGYFAVLIDQGESQTPYQGITPITGTTIARCAESFFEQSEQLATRIVVATERSAADNKICQAGGILVQHMPKKSSDSPRRSRINGNGHAAGHDDWCRVSSLLATATKREIAGDETTSEMLLYRLFHEEQPRVFERQPVEFGCTCSPEKVRRSLSVYSARDISTMTTDQGTVDAVCQFCGATYVFDPASLGFEAQIG
ncbi:MAG: Hsp33 family molecular chaperone HslO [Albidovulum sp.]|nr:Hsp33 family molecular chaperone HslO [Albidovulum sp.]MDE0306086.1 Hsp33 family molecular chaperone HslO [Albidovulum sp.]MDE0531795.1 Hsp33 family molecular chaperone HslO [Albidovulum sp.]